MDSATALAMARAEGRDVYALSFDYGQRHRIELESAVAVARSLGAREHLVIKIDMRGIGGSALTTEAEVPRHGPDGTIPVTYVPARNTIFLSFALAWAEALGVWDIFIGANAVDYSGYPDCRPEYIRAYEEMANLATKVSVEGTRRFRVHAPLMHMKKAEIINRGRALGVDYSMTWSCYDPRDDGTPCGGCQSCVIRERGLSEAGPG
jgi:7-cyano-7-deazaguanine synthase